jgi:arabinan endo-1,5-alpha-L-arabinosidase
MEYPIHVHDLNVADPAILADAASKKYYLYANQFTCGQTPAERKGTGETFYALVSEDLVHWSNPVLVFEQNQFWGSQDYQSPECWLYEGKYYLLAGFSAPGRLRRIQPLVANSPLGPFAPWGEPLTPPAWQTLDGTLYIDKAGDPWLVFAHDWVQVYDGQVAAVKLAGDLSHAIGNPVVLFRNSDASWTDDFMYTEEGGVVRGPAVHRMKDGGLVILWTGLTPYGLAVGIARSESDEIYGPWRQYDKPVYCLDGGNPSLFRHLDDGMLMMALYHRGVDGPAGKGPGIKTCLYEMEEVHYGLLEIVNEFTGNWWGSIGGHPIAYRAREPVTAEPLHSRLGSYYGFFGPRRIQWGMAPETKFNKGRITTKD